MAQGKGGLPGRTDVCYLIGQLGRQEHMGVCKCSHRKHVSLGFESWSWHLVKADLGIRLYLSNLLFPQL